MKDDSLIGHWKLAGDATDSSGNGNHGADLSASGFDGRPNTAAGFDGRSSLILVPHTRSLDLGADDFSITARIHTDPDVDDAIGDVVSKYDPSARRGFNLNVVRHAGVVTSQSNNRNVHFGIDNGVVDSEWTDRGRPGNAVFVSGLAVYEGELFAATFETERTESGHVYRYAGDSEWVDCGAPDSSNTVMSMAVYQGHLYAGTGRYKAAGSLLRDSSNGNEGGSVFRYQGGSDWTDCGRLGGEPSPFAEYVHDSVQSLQVFDGHLYAIPTYTQGLFRYDGGTTWTECGSPGSRLLSMASFRGQLYLLQNGDGWIFRYESGGGWSRWTRCGRLPGVEQPYAFLVYEGKLHVSTWPEARVFRYENDDEWTDVGRLGQEMEVMGMAVYNGKMYAGTLPLAEVYRYDGQDAWTPTGRLDTTPGVTYRRAWSAAVFDGKLFFGTLPSGHVYSLEAGRSATYDRELDPGWRDLAAVRHGSTLKLYVDRRLASTSSTFDPAEYDISNDRPLKIGLGAHDYFHGRISDLRLYRRALADDEIAL